MNKLKFSFTGNNIHTKTANGTYSIYQGGEGGIFDVAFNGDVVFFGYLDECLVYCHEKEFGKPKLTEATPKKQATPTIKKLTSPEKDNNETQSPY